MPTTFELTWQTDANRVPTQDSIVHQAGYHLWYIKAILKNAGLSQPASAGAWTVWQSSDSTAVGTAGDGVDRWTDTFDATKLVRAAAGTAHSWMVLTKTINGITWYVTLDFAAASDWVATITVARNTPSGGTTLNRPTATGEQQYSPSQIVESSLSSMHLHSNLATDGSFITYASKDGSGQFHFSFAFLPMKTIRASDAWPVYSYCEWSGSNVWLITTLNNTGTTTAKLRDFANGSNVVAITCTINTSAGRVMSDMGTTDASDSKDDDFPVWIYVPTTSFKSIRGRLADVCLAPESLAVGTVEPASGPPYNSVVIGNFWHPWAASAAPSL